MTAIWMGARSPEERRESVVVGLAAPAGGLDHLAANVLPQVACIAVPDALGC